MNAQTRPPASNPTDHERWRREYQELNKLNSELDDAMRGDSPKFGARYSMHDKRLNAIVSWLAALGVLLASAALIWIISTTATTEKSIAILLDRPAPVSKTQYDADRQEMLTAIHNLQTDVKDIQLKQAATLESNRTR